MREAIDDERVLDADPLAARLMSVQVPPMSDQLGATALRHAATVRSSHRPVTWRLGATVALAGVLLLIVMTPVSAMVERAVLPDWLQQRIGLVGGAAQLSPGVTSLSPIAGGAVLPCSKALALKRNAACYPDLSLSDAQRQAAFTIPLPEALPAGLEFRGAIVDSPHSVFLSFGDASGRSALGLWVKEGTAIGGSSVPLSSIRSAQVNGSRAYYVRGSYSDSGPGTAAHWNPAADDAELTWQANGFAYDLTMHGLNVSSAELIRIGESIR